MKINIATVVLTCFLLCAATRMQGVLEYKIPENFDMTQTALVTPAVKLKDNGTNVGGPLFTGPRLGITAIKAIDQQYFVKTKGYQSIRLVPGSYELGLSCVGGSYQQGMSQVLAVEAGKEYLLACTGNSKRQAKLVISVRSLPPGNARE